MVSYLPRVPQQVDRGTIILTQDCLTPEPVLLISLEFGASEGTVGLCEPNFTWDLQKFYL